MSAQAQWAIDSAYSAVSLARVQAAVSVGSAGFRWCDDRTMVPAPTAAPDRAGALAAAEEWPRSRDLPKRMFYRGRRHGRPTVFRGHRLPKDCRRLWFVHPTQLYEGRVAGRVDLSNGGAPASRRSRSGGTGAGGRAAIAIESFAQRSIAGRSRSPTHLGPLVVSV